MERGRARNKSIFATKITEVTEKFRFNKQKKRESSRNLSGCGA
jgi:hypothetical protein